MKIILWVMLAFSFQALTAQNNFIGLKAGTILANTISGNPAENTTINNPYRPGFSGGITYEYVLKKRFLIGVDFIYNQRRFVNSGISTVDFSQIELSRFDYNYLSIPVKTGLLFGNKIYGFGNIGICPSILVDAKHHIPVYDANGNRTGTQTIDITDHITKPDIAGMLEIGGGYRFRIPVAVGGHRYTTQICLFMSLAYQQSFSSTTHPVYFTGDKIRQYGLTFSAGIRYALTGDS